MWGSLKVTNKLLVFSGIAIVALIVSILTHTWVPVFIAVALDVGITGMMIQISKQNIIV